MKPILIALVISATLAYACHGVYVTLERSAMRACVDLHPELPDQRTLCRAIHGGSE